MLPLARAVWTLVGMPHSESRLSRRASGLLRRLSCPWNNVVLNGRGAKWPR